MLRWNNSREMLELLWVKASYMECHTPRQRPFLLAGNHRNGITFMQLQKGGTIQCGHRSWRDISVKSENEIALLLHTYCNLMLKAQERKQVQLNG